MAKIKKEKKNLTLPVQIVEQAQDRANQNFGGNFSAYVAFLISQDINGVTMQQPCTITKEVMVTNEAKEQELIEKDPEVKQESRNMVKNILSGGINLEND